ncbi:MAG: DUF1634 domain-containing protein [Prevotellaceae bacterium]|jgi:uncharacterized membrane protein|nr:DUF1634 domain-containing protein [Prevotellaceae bacterium]
MYKIFKKLIFRLEKDADLHIGKLLRRGMLLACGTSIFGGVVYLFQHSGTTVDYSPVSGSEAFGVADSLRSISGIFDGILKFNGASIIQLGVVILIATPILRIVFSSITFIIEKDWLYVAITITVLTIIFLNMMILK